MKIYYNKTIFPDTFNIGLPICLANGSKTPDNWKDLTEEEYVSVGGW